VPAQDVLARLVVRAQLAELICRGASLLLQCIIESSKAPAQFQERCAQIALACSWKQTLEAFMAEHDTSTARRRPAALPAVVSVRESTLPAAVN